MEEKESRARALLDKTNRQFNECNALYHAAAQRCGLSDAAFWTLYALVTSCEPLTQNRIAAAGTQFLHVVAVAVTDVDNFRTMGSTLHIDTGQVAGVVGDNISKANRLIAVVFDIRSSLIGFAGLREDLQAGQLREVLIVRLGLDMRQLLGEEDACIVSSIHAKNRTGERVLIGLIDKRRALAGQGSAILLAVAVCGVKGIKLRHGLYLLRAALRTGQVRCRSVPHR